MFNLADIDQNGDLSFAEFNQFPRILKFKKYTELSSIDTEENKKKYLVRAELKLTFHLI